MSDELKNPPAVPPHLSHVFEWFKDLNETRRNYVGMSFAYAPLSYAEIKSYFDLYRLSASTFEMKLLHEFDAIYLDTMRGDD